jgi:hypothetical protein
MARGKKHSPEQIVSLLRQIEVAVANGKRLDLPVKRPPSRSRRTTAGAKSLWAWLNTPLEGPPAAKNLCEQLPMPLMS